MHGKDFRDFRAATMMKLAPAPDHLTFEAAMFGMGPMEMMVVALVVLLLFGTRLPSVMRSLGVGVTEFKKGLKGEGMTDPNATIEDKRRDDL